jgi:PPOX class probable F420-dependent enzyme
MPISTATPLEALARHHDMALQTRKRDGSWVTTPVNPLVENDHVYFRTWNASGKAKRLRNFPDVRFAPSTARGRPIGEWMHGRAMLLEGDDAAHAARLINRHYPLLQGIAVRLYHRLRRFQTLQYRIDISAGAARDSTMDENQQREQLHAVADRLDIEALRAEFADALMMHDFDRFAWLFTEDAAWRIPYIDIELVGRQNIRAGIERMQGLWDYFVQLAHPGSTQINGNTAVGRCYIVEFGRMRDGKSELNYSVYHDRYQRTPDGWKFAERLYEVRYLDATPLAGSVPAHAY